MAFGELRLLTPIDMMKDDDERAWQYLRSIIEVIEGSSKLGTRLV